MHHGGRRLLSLEGELRLGQARHRGRLLEAVAVHPLEHPAHPVVELHAREPRAEERHDVVGMVGLQQRDRPLLADDADPVPREEDLGVADHLVHASEIGLKHPVLPAALEARAHRKRRRPGREASGHAREDRRIQCHARDRRRAGRRARREPARCDVQRDSTRLQGQIPRSGNAELHAGEYPQESEGLLLLVERAFAEELGEMLGVDRCARLLPLGQLDAVLRLLHAQVLQPDRAASEFGLLAGADEVQLRRVALLEHAKEAALHLLGERRELLGPLDQRPVTVGRRAQRGDTGQRDLSATRADRRRAVAGVGRGREGHPASAADRRCSGRS